MKSERVRIARRLRNIEALARLQIAIIIALLIGLCAFATNIYEATDIGQAIQSVEGK